MPSSWVASIDKLTLDALGIGSNDRLTQEGILAERPPHQRCLHRHMPFQMQMQARAALAKRRAETARQAVFERHEEGGRGRGKTSTAVGGVGGQRARHRNKGQSVVHAPRAKSANIGPGE